MSPREGILAVSLPGIWVWSMKAAKV
jgi:hypothetical protein